MIIITVTDLDNKIVERVEVCDLAIEETRKLRAKDPDTDLLHVTLHNSIQVKRNTNTNTNRRNSMIITVTDLDNKIVGRVEDCGLVIEETRKLRAKYPDTDFTVRRDHVRNKRMVDDLR